MKIALLVYETPEDFAARTDPEKSAAYLAAWPPYAGALYAAGLVLSGAGLEHPDTATTIRPTANGPLVQDGPFPETREQLGGYFLLEVPDMETALDWAKKCPVGIGGRVEVRPALVPPALSGG